MVLANQIGCGCLWVSITKLNAAHHAWLSSNEAAAINTVQAWKNLYCSCKIGAVFMLHMVLSCYMECQLGSSSGGTWHLPVQVPWRPGRSPRWHRRRRPCKLCTTSPACSLCAGKKVFFKPCPDPESSAHGASAAVSLYLYMCALGISNTRRHWRGWLTQQSHFRGSMLCMSYAPCSYRAISGGLHAVQPLTEFTRVLSRPYREVIFLGLVINRVYQQFCL